MAVATGKRDTISFLQDKATRLRIHSIRSTTEAGSGHPTSCASAAEIMAALFFHVMRYDPANPRDPRNDQFVLSKGHAAPILYAAWAEAGAIPERQLLGLRKLSSDLEGHPTPRWPYVPVATGSLGQGLSVGVGMALDCLKLERSGQRVYVVQGDGETAEGAVWEAAACASHYDLGNLCLTVDVNRLGQSEPTMLQHDLTSYQKRWEAFGWKALVVDGHNLAELLEAYEDARLTKDRPAVVLALTRKGKGLPSVEDQEGKHGKPLPQDEADAAVRILQEELSASQAPWTPKLPSGERRSRSEPGGEAFPAPPFKPGDEPVATRQAFGKALAALGTADPRIVVLDGDVKDSTYTKEFEKQHPERFFQMYIAEQNMVGAAMGLAAMGKVPFATSFAVFLTRAADFIRMAAISGSNLKLVGSHVGVSIGQDGPSQMGLEDLALMCAEPNFTVFYPSDAVSAWAATRLAAELTGPAYVRTSRPPTPVLYEAGEQFQAGRCKVIRAGDRDQATVVAGGITLFEALKAHEELGKQGISVRVIDLFSVKPVDGEALKEAAAATGGRVLTVEDHYLHGGLGDAVQSALAGTGAAVHKLGVGEIPRSGAPDELLDHHGISARHIVEKIREMVA